MSQSGHTGALAGSLRAFSELLVGASIGFTAGSVEECARLAASIVAFSVVIIRVVGEYLAWRRERVRLASQELARSVEASLRSRADRREEYRELP